MGEPTVEQYEAGIDSRLPGVADHLNQNIGLFAQRLFTPFPAVGPLVDVTHIGVGPVAGCMKSAIQREKVQPVVKAQLQVLVPMFCLSWKWRIAPVELTS